MAEHTPEPGDFPEQDIQRILRELLSGNAQNLPDGIGFDPSQFAKAAGLPSDPAALQALFAGLRGAMQNQSGEIDWDLAKRTATDVAKQTPGPDAASVRPAYDRDFQVASLWLSEATQVSPTPDAPRTMSRVEWVLWSIDTWTSFAEPVATSIADALTTAIAENAPEELASQLGGAEAMMRSIGGALFALQLGTVVGKLSEEVVGAGDIGIPLLEGPGREGGALIPQNVAAFSAGLDQSADEVRLYLAVRELAHARLFRHARWLRLHLISAITDYARGIHIDVSRMEELASDFDPANPEQIKAALTDGSLIPPKTEVQLAAHQRIETILALIEGWVDQVTREATSRLPGATAIAEMVRRRRASGGPAESAFSTLIGLELRPRALREAAALWQTVAERGGAEARDALWAHPDILPTAEEIQQPELLLSRIGLAERAEAGEPATEDPFDLALAELLGDAPRPVEGEFGGLVSDPEEGPDADQAPEGDDEPERGPAAS